MTQSITEIVTEHIAAERTTLPIFDRTTQRLQAMMNQREFDMGAVEELICGDPVLTTATLRMANSSFFSGLEKVVSVRDAVVRLGVKQVSNLVTLVTQKKNYELEDAALRPLVATLWKHSVACAVGTQWLAERIKRNDIAGEAFMAGMLHDVGKLFLLRVVDDMKKDDASFEPPEALVHELLDSLHAKHGAVLMQKWNIPEVYCNVVLKHHEPDFDDDDTLLIMVRLVDQACNKLGMGLNPQPELNLAASAEAQVLRIGDVLSAELEIKLEDAADLAGQA